MSSESTARNRATLEEATNSAHFESTFFMSPLGGDGYGKTSRDIPSTVAPGKTAPALGSLEPAPRCIKNWGPFAVAKASLTEICLCWQAAFSGVFLLKTRGTKLRIVCLLILPAAFYSPFIFSLLVAHPDPLLTVCNW